MPHRSCLQKRWFAGPTLVEVMCGWTPAPCCDQMCVTRTSSEHRPVVMEKRGGLGLEKC